jgi:hypothetical protein
MAEVQSHRRTAGHRREDRSLADHPREDRSLRVVNREDRSLRVVNREDRSLRVVNQEDRSLRVVVRLRLAEVHPAGPSRPEAEPPADHNRRHHHPEDRSLQVDSHHHPARESTLGYLCSSLARDCQGRPGPSTAFRSLAIARY